MKITNGVTEIRYCGNQLTGRDLIVSGNYVVLTFHTDGLLENKRGFELGFYAWQLGKFRPVVQAVLDVQTLRTVVFFYILITHVKSKADPTAKLKV